jgi:hypothetical protein
MRLGQLARKLAIRPSAIVDYLAAQNLASDEGTNTKLSEEVTRNIILHFNPSALDILLESPAAEPLTQTTVEEVENEIAEPHTVSSNEELPLEEVKKDVEQTSVEDLKVETSDLFANVTVIKAPKVSLAGLKVIGKIDLPEPKKKEVEEAADETKSKTISIDSAPKKFRERKQSKFQGDRKQRKTSINPIALQREKEAREAEEKRREQIKREKEIRTQRYYQRVKPTAPTKPARIYDEPLLQMKDHQQKKEPTTWWGRFWRWYTT